MGATMVVETAMEFLVPSWWEVQVTLAAAAFVVVAYWFFSIGCDGGRGGGDRAFEDGSGSGADMAEDKDKMLSKGESQTNSAYLIKVELLAAKNLIGANLNGTSDPYAIITCGSEKRFSFMVPGSRNPMWGEEFNFSVDELLVEWMDFLSPSTFFCNNRERRLRMQKASYEDQLKRATEEVTMLTEKLRAKDLDFEVLAAELEYAVMKGDEWKKWASDVMKKIRIEVLLIAVLAKIVFL